MRKDRCADRRLGRGPGPDRSQRVVVSAVPSCCVRRGTGLLGLCAGVSAALLLTAPVPQAAADHDGVPLDLVALPLQEATDAIASHHDGADVEIALSPETPPAGVTDELLLVVAQRYTPALDDVGPQHFWSLDLGTLVPNVASLDRAAAIQALAASGFKAVPTPAEAADDWLVTGSDPSAGQLVTFGTPVRVDLTAPESELVVVPDLDGATEGEAGDTLKAAALVIDVGLVDGDEADAGRVVGQDPGPGTEVAPGSTVTVRVARATQVSPGGEEVSAGSRLPWLAGGLGALFLLGLAAGAATLISATPGRQRAWVRRHVSGRPHTGSWRSDVEGVPGAGGSSAVRLVPHPDSGSQQLTEVSR